MQAIARAAIRRVSQQQLAGQSQRQMSGLAKHSQEEELREMVKWRWVTALAIPVLVAYGVWMATLNHHHEHGRPAYSYLRIRTKEFPWGDCGLFEHCEAEHEQE